MDIEDFKGFVSKSDKLERRDIEIIENKNYLGKTESYTIKLESL